MVNHLEIPQELAGSCIDGDQRGAEQIIAGTIYAYTIIVRGSEGHEEDATLDVESHQAPDVDA